MRRPLVAVFDEHMLVGTSPMERLLDSFGWQSNAIPPYVQWCAQPHLTFRDAAHIATTLGFEKTPPKRVDRYPQNALTTPETGRRQHPVWFLQWGWAIKPAKQILVEIGDATFFAGLHFIKEHPGNNGTPWHLDHIELFNRSTTPLNVACGSAGERDTLRRLMMCVQGTIANLNADNWEAAEKLFHHTLDDVMRTLQGNPRIIDPQTPTIGELRRRHS